MALDISRLLGVPWLSLAIITAPNASGAQSTVSAVVVAPAHVSVGLQLVIPAAGFGSVASVMPSAFAPAAGEAAGTSVATTAVAPGNASPVSKDLAASGGVEGLRAQASNGTLGGGLATGVMVPPAGAAAGQPVSITVSYN